MKKLLLPLLFITTLTMGQQKDEDIIRSIFDEALVNGQSYQMLDYLSNEIGSRLTGSPGAAAAVDWTKQVMESFEFDKVYLQEVIVPHWVRGNVEQARVVNSQKMGTVELSVCALGNSVGTGKGGISANIIEVKSFEDLEQLGKKNIEGKIVFFNRPMDPKHVRTGAAYGGAVEQRVNGPSEAAKYGAVGVVVRSMTLAFDDTPHTGSTVYDPEIDKIPAIAVSTMGANLLSSLLKDDPNLTFYFEIHSQMLPDVKSYNVIGEITGSENPEEIILVGGHLDSWDLGDGSHDDGAGCVHSIEVLRIFKSLGIKPKNTIRVVMFMNEENGLRGGRLYAEEVLNKKEKHIAALESDSGGFTPRGFGITGSEQATAKFMSFKKYFEPYGILEFLPRGGGADIGPLRSQGVPVLGFIPDSQRYFDYHHTSIDTFDKVNRRELELGAAAMAALIYLIDSKGLE